MVERSLSGEYSEIKERMFGICIFDRDANYDTSSDSIVRVTATDVRKRLLRYYEAAPASALRIELPPGSYIPEFHHVAADSRASPLLVVDAGLERDLNGISGDHASGHTLEASRIPRRTSLGRQRLIGIHNPRPEEHGSVFMHSRFACDSPCWWAQFAWRALHWVGVWAPPRRDAVQPFTNPQYSFKGVTRSDCHGSTAGNDDRAEQSTTVCFSRT